LRIKALYGRDDLAIRFTLRSRHFTEEPSPPPSDRTASALARVNNAAYYAIMAFALAGLLLCFARQRNREYDSRWWLLLGLILYNTATYAMIFGIDRYRYPTMPYFCVFAGYALGAAVSVIEARIWAKRAAQFLPL
jgi:hypothetical protein